MARRPKTPFTPVTVTAAAPRPAGLEIRLTGLPDEVLAGAETLATVFELIEVSRAYPCRRSRNVRAYLQVRFKTATTPPAISTTEDASGQVGRMTRDAQAAKQ